MLDYFITDDIEAFIMTSGLLILPKKGDFSDWMDAQAYNLDAFLELVDRDHVSQRSPDQVYLEQFGIKPASSLMKMEFHELTFYYPKIIPSIDLTLLAALPKLGSLGWF